MKVTLRQAIENAKSKGWVKGKGSLGNPRANTCCVLGAAYLTAHNLDEIIPQEDMLKDVYGKRGLNDNIWRINDSVDGSWDAVAWALDQRGLLDYELSFDEES